MNELFEKYLLEHDSQSAILIDIYSTVKIMDFYGNYLTKEKIGYNYVTSSFLLSIMNLIRYEIYTYTKNTNNLSNIDKSLRAGVHQFRKNNFSNRKRILIDKMGISFDFSNPLLDFNCFVINKKIYSTNILDFYLDAENFNEVKKQDYFNFLMNYFRTLYELNTYNVRDSNYILKIKKNLENKKYKELCQPYSMVSIIRKSSIKEEKLIVRLLLGFSQLGSILILLKELILIDEEIKEYPYFNYFLIKMTCFTVDETIDNIDCFVQHSEDTKLTKKLSELININIQEKEKIRNLRNNFHYTSQTQVFKNISEVSSYLEEVMNVCTCLHDGISNILNIKYRIATFNFYKLVKWTEYGMKKH